MKSGVDSQDPAYMGDTIDKRPLVVERTLA